MKEIMSSRKIFRKMFVTYGRRRKKGREHYGRLIEYDYYFYLVTYLATESAV
jgi:hypothetical protein